MTPAIRVSVSNWEHCRNEAVPIRYQVFVEEQQVPVELEQDDHDIVCRHALARTGDGTAIATGRLLPDGHIGRMAVLTSFRGRGIGSLVLNALVQEAQRLGYRHVVLSAQCHARAFYEKHGFIPRGDTYLEAGIPHIEMILPLV
ncbi:MAG: GNAT family N-acetyltransferase [Burkholderiaceae bacterium]